MANDTPYKHLYNQARWRGPRGLQRYTLRRYPFCVMCAEINLVTPSSVADHIVPHKGDKKLFFDPANTQGLCAPCHDGRKKRMELRGFDDAIGGDGWPLDDQHPVNKGR